MHTHLRSDTDVWLSRLKTELVCADGGCAGRIPPAPPVKRVCCVFLFMIFILIENKNFASFAPALDQTCCHVASEVGRKGVSHVIRNSHVTSQEIHMTVYTFVGPCKWCVSGFLTAFTFVNVLYEKSYCYCSSIAYSPMSKYKYNRK